MIYKLPAVLLAFFLYAGTTVSAQVSGYLSESFESPVFPPAGWIRTSVSGSNQWQRSTTEHVDGVASAWMQYQSATAEDWLISPQFSVVAGDSVRFYLLLDFAGYQPDSLCVKVSTTTNATAAFTTTLLKLQEGTNYPPNATSWYRYAVSLNAFAGQNVYVAFKHYNNNGDGLYIDKVGIGTLPPYDAATTAINTTSNVGAVTLEPSAIVKNNGTVTSTFNVTAQITPGGYTSTQTVTALAPAASAPVTFAAWTPAPGTYTLKVYTQLPTDLVHTNDTLYKTITVFPDFPEHGWESAEALPAGRWAHASAFSKPCAAGTDTAYLYVLSGNDASLALTASCLRQNLVTGTWSAIADIPAARQQFSAAELGGKIYVPGGYAAAFAPVNTMEIYDPATNIWTSGAVMPLAVGDYAIATYTDSLIYVIGGYNGSTDVNTVQIYNIFTNTWTSGTAKTSTATSGGRMGIANNQIVYLGGYSQSLGATQSIAVLGTIDPVNPAVITWSSLPPSPMGPTGRLAGGTGFNDGRIYFTSGDPAGAGTGTILTTAAYNTLTGQWELGPDKLTAVSNTANFTMILANDSMYMAVTGGYTGSSVVSVNEWLNIGPYTITAAAGDDFAICGPGTAALSATGGIAYSWTPASELNNATIAAPTATLSETDTFFVNIVQRYGCAIEDTMIVTVNLSVSSSQNIELCFGETVTIGTNIYSTSGTYTDVFQVGNSCDSTITTILTILPANTLIQNPVICFDETYTVGSSIYAATGTYTDTLTSALTGCDSIVTTNLTVHGFISSSLSVSFCPGGSVTVGTETYSIPGDYNQTFTAVSGCDSVVMITVTSNSSFTLTVTANGATLTADQSADTYQWIDCASGLPIAGQTSQSFTATVNGSYAVMISLNGCDTVTECGTITTVGLEEQALLHVSVYPNPNNGQFTVTATEAGSFRLTDELGKTVSAFELNTENAFSAQLSGLSNGVYYLSGVSGAKTVVQKIVITD